MVVSNIVFVDWYRSILRHDWKTRRDNPRSGPINCTNCPFGILRSGALPILDCKREDEAKSIACSEDQMCAVTLPKSIQILINHPWTSQMSFKGQSTGILPTRIVL